MLRSVAVFFVLGLSLSASVASAVYPDIVCENLILDAKKNQLVMELNPVLDRAALHRELGRLIQFTEAQIQAVPQELTDAWTNRVYANDFIGIGLLRSLVHATGLSTPTEITEINTKRAMLDKRLGRLRALSVLLSQVSHISAVLAPARQIPDTHPDAPFEIEINQWIETRAVESIYALVQLAMVNPAQLSDERKQNAEALYARFVTELTNYSAYLETDIDSDSRSPLVAPYLDDVSVAKLAEVRRWAENEFGGTVERDFLIQFVSALVLTPGLMSEHLKVLSGVHKQSESFLGNSLEGQKGFLVIARGVLLRQIDPATVRDSLREATEALSGSRAVLQSISPETLGHFVYLRGMTGKSMTELVREFNAIASTLLYQEVRSVDVRTHPNSQQVVLLLLYADAKQLSGRPLSVSEFPAARRLLERLPRAWTLAPDEFYLASSVLISLSHFTEVEAINAINYIQEIYSIVESDPIADCNYRFFEWIRLAYFGLERGIPAPAMVQFLRTARQLRGHVPPADRVVNVLANVQDNSSSREGNALDAFTPQALADGFAVPFSYDLDVVCSLIPDSTAVDFPLVANGGWNFIEGLKPDATLATYLQGGPSLFLTAGEDGAIDWQMPASIYSGESRVGLPVRTGP